MRQLSLLCHSTIASALLLWLLILSGIHSIVLITLIISNGNRKSCQSTRLHSAFQRLISFSGHSGTTGSDVRRRQWPRIKFEDFYELSGDGPLVDDNVTETYLWTTIVTQIRATVWPTVTRVRVTTPKPKPIVVTSTPLFSCHKYWSQISYTMASESISVDPLDSVLQRSSMVYPGL